PDPRPLTDPRVRHVVSSTTARGRSLAPLGGLHEPRAGQNRAATRTARRCWSLPPLGEPTAAGAPDLRSRGSAPRLRHRQRPPDRRADRESGRPKWPGLARGLVQVLVRVLARGLVRVLVRVLGRALLRHRTGRCRYGARRPSNCVARAWVVL